MTTHFAPGPVTRQQLEEYRLAYETAKQQERRALVLMKQLADAHSEMMAECERTALRYVWAKQGMLRVRGVEL